jgi:hypothetical protein
MSGLFALSGKTRDAAVLIVTLPYPGIEDPDQFFL